MSKRTMTEARSLFGKRRQGSQWIVTDHTLRAGVLDESSPMHYALACQEVRERREAWLNYSG